MLRKIDAICDRFEADLKRGKTPEIRSALDEIEAEARPELFQQLLGVQQSMLAKPPAATELLAEFPEFHDEVIGVCARGAEAMLREIQPDERYEAGEEVARGGMGAIRLANDVALRRQVAIKSMLAGDASTEELARFIEEAQITGQLDHPGIVPIYEIGVDADGQPFYTMQFVRGRDLQAVLKEDELSLRQLLNILNRVCDAVAFAHSRGVLHRDLKPANIRIGEFGEVFVMDWGLAKILGKTEKPTAAEKVESIRGESVTGEFHTLAGSVMGSPEYMAPEQASGAAYDLDERADVYALGAILYEILTNRPPIVMESGEDVREVLKRVQKGEIEPPNSNEALGKVAMKALATDREDRYASVTEFQAEIDAWLGGFATEAEHAGLFRQIALFVRRNRIASAAAAIILLVLAGAAGVYVKGEVEKREHSRQSAPAYFKAALALERQGDFDDALTTLEQTIQFDPNLPNTHVVQCFLLARAGRFDEALAIGRALPDQQLLTNTLERIVAEPEVNHLPKLAKLASEADLPTTATDLLAQSAKRFELELADGLPIWNAKLRQGYPGLKDDGIRIGSEWGLELGFDSRDLAVVTSLEPLRDIPLNNLSLSGLNVTSLAPLKGMPLRRIVINQTPVASFDGLEDSPLEEVNFIYNPAKVDAEFLRALDGKRLDSLSLNGDQIETSALERIQATRLELDARVVTSLAFLREQENLRELSIRDRIGDNDCTPVLDCRQLQKFEGFGRLHQILDPVWAALNDESATEEARLAAALEEVRVLESRAVSPALETTRQTLDLLRFLIERKQGLPAKLGKWRALTVATPGGRVFVRFHSGLTDTTKNDDPPDFRALAFLGAELASIHNAEENRIAVEMTEGGGLGIGARRTKKNPDWHWSDGSTWDFSGFPTGEESREIRSGVQRAAIRSTGLWLSKDYRDYGGFLIQFPAAWLDD